MTDKLEVPRRRIKKNWYVGLDVDPVDRSHPDVRDDQLVSEAAERKSVSRKFFAKSDQFFTFCCCLFYLFYLSSEHANCCLSNLYLLNLSSAG